MVTYGALDATVLRNRLPLKTGTTEITRSTKPLDLPAGQCQQKTATNEYSVWELHASDGQRLEKLRNGFAASLRVERCASGR